MTQSIEKFTDSFNSYSFDKITLAIGNRTLLQDACISLAPNKRYGIIGPNGVGKTTLLKFINSKIDSSIYIDQYVTDDMQDWYTSNIVEIILKSNRERFELIQNYNDAVVKLDNSEISNEEFASITSELSSINVDKDESEVKVILRKLGFSNEDLIKQYKDFSGGWKARINLARALYMKPKVLLLDEPTNHLDMEAIIWLESYLQESKSIILVISHDVHFINVVCTNIIYIHNGKLSSTNGNYSKWKKQQIKDIEKQTKEWEKLMKDISCLKNKNKKKEADALMEKRTKDGITRPDKPYSIVMNFTSATNAKSPYLKCEDVCFSYGKKEIVNNLDLTIGDDSRITIVGLNGCGKSTIMKLLIGDLKPTSGNIQKGNNVRVSVFTQHSIETLPFDMTPIEYLQDKYNLPMEEIRKVLGKIALGKEEHKKPISQLSGGQKMRIVFSEIVIEQPHLILFDEPTNHLDLETIDALIEGINEYNGSIVTITHNIDLIERTESDVYLLCNTQLERLDSINDYIETIINEDKV